MVATICNSGLNVQAVAHAGRSCMLVAVRTQRCLGSAGTLPFFELVPAMAFWLLPSCNPRCITYLCSWVSCLYIAIQK